MISVKIWVLDSVWNFWDWVEKKNLSWTYSVQITQQLVKYTVWFDESNKGVCVAFVALRNWEVLQ